MIALVRTSGTPEDRQQGPVAADRRPVAARRHDAPDPATSPATRTSARCSSTACSCADDALIGAEGEGWEQVTAELAFERSGPERIYSSIVLLDAWLDWLRARREPSPADARAGRARSPPQLAVLRSHVDRRSPAQLAGGQSPIVEAALVKDLGTTLEQLHPGLAIADDAARRPRRHSPAAELQRTLNYVNAGGAGVLAARRHARDPARHDRPRPRAALIGTDDAQTTARPTRSSNCSPASLTPQACCGSRGRRLAGRALDAIERSGFSDALVPEDAGRRRPGLRRRLPVLEACGRHALPLAACRDDGGAGAAGRARGRRRPPARSPSPRPPARDRRRRARGYGAVADWVLVGTARAWCCSMPARREPSGSMPRSIDASAALARRRARQAAPRRLRRRPAQRRGLPARGAAPGAMRRCSIATLQYANERAQFGKPDRQVPGDPAPARRDGRAERSRRRMAAQLGCAQPTPRPDRRCCARDRQGATSEAARAGRADRPRDARRHRHHRGIRPAAASPGACMPGAPPAGSRVVLERCASAAALVASGHAAALGLRRHELAAAPSQPEPENQP